MKTLFLALIAVVPEPSLSITASAQELQQLDHVIVKCVLRNDTDLSVTIDRRGAATSNAIRLEVKAQGEWRPLVAMIDQFGVPAIGLGADPILESGAIYTQYNVYLYAGMGFVFDEPGTYEIRASVQCSGNVIESNTIEIVVKERDARSRSLVKESAIDTRATFTPGMSVEEMKRQIAASRRRGKFAEIGSIWFDGDMHAGLADLADVGGNLGQGIERLQLLSKILAGAESPGDDIAAYVRKKFDNRVDADVALHVLGRHYQKQKDWANLAKVVAALPDKTMLVYQWERELAALAQTVPRVVVPSSDK